MFLQLFMSSHSPKFLQILNGYDKTLMFSRENLNFCLGVMNQGRHTLHLGPRNRIPARDRVLDLSLRSFFYSPHHAHEEAVELELSYQNQEVESFIYEVTIIREEKFKSTWGARLSAYPVHAVQQIILKKIENLGSGDSIGPSLREHKTIIFNFFGHKVLEGTLIFGGGQSVLSTTQLICTDMNNVHIVPFGQVAQKPSENQKDPMSCSIEEVLKKMNFFCRKADKIIEIKTSEKTLIEIMFKI